jgi:RNA polymerase sigma-70 factor (ECF subfamily)
MFLRKKEGLKIIEEEYAGEVAQGDSQIGRMAANEIFQLITALPVGYRAVFNLHVVEGYNHKEIAGLLGITEGTSKSQLAKARALLQKTILLNQK